MGSGVSGSACHSRDGKGDCLLKCDSYFSDWLQTMFARLMPKEGKFFDLFNAHAAYCVQGGKKLQELIEKLGNDERAVKEITDIIESTEEKADVVTHETVVLLNQTFITPLDRDEIHQLIVKMDDILDVVQDVAQSLAMYDVRRATPDIRQLVELSVSAIDRVKSAVALLPNLGDNAQDILKTCNEIDRLESDADKVMRGALSRLFRDEQDVRELIKLKAIYELMETITDRCQSVGNLIEGIVLENA